MKGAGARNRIRARRARRIAQRAARRTRGREHALPRASSLAEYAAAAAAGARTHVMIDERGNVSTVEVDPVKFAAALARFDTHPHDPAGADGGDDLGDFDVPDGAGLDDDDDSDGDRLSVLDDDCPICRALAEATVGTPRRGWSLDG